MLFSTGDAHYLNIYLAVFVFFFALSYPLTRLAAFLEKRRAGSAAYLVRDGERVVEDREAFVQLLARDVQRRREHDHVPVDEEVEACVERGLRQLRDRLGGLAGGVERYERLARLPVAHELEAPEETEPADVADRGMPLLQRA